MCLHFLNALAWTEFVLGILRGPCKSTLTPCLNNVRATVCLLFASFLPHFICCSACMQRANVSIGKPKSDRGLFTFAWSAWWTIYKWLDCVADLQVKKALNSKFSLNEGDSWRTPFWCGQKLVLCRAGHSEGANFLGTSYMPAREVAHDVQCQAVLMCTIGGYEPSIHVPVRVTGFRMGMVFALKQRHELRALARSTCVLNVRAHCLMRDGVARKYAQKNPHAQVC